LDDALVPRSSPRTIWTLIGVESMSLLGSEIARFGVSVWIYEATRSVGAFSALLLANTVPGMIASPLAGSIVDRSSRKRVMIGAATVSLCGTLIVLAGAMLGTLSMGMVVAGACLASVGEAFQFPALEATVPLMASEDDLPRYNGFLESGRAISMLAGPAIGGFLLGLTGLPGLLAIEVTTFVAATVVIAAMAIPRPRGSDDGDDEPVSLLADSVYGVRWIYRHKALLKLLLVALFANFFIGVGSVLMAPYALSFLSEREFGITNGLFGGGVFVGGIAYGLLARRFSNVQQFFAGALACGAVYVAYGFSRDLYSLGAMNFLFALAMTITNAAIMTVWQTKVPEDVQGRVLATMFMLVELIVPVSYVVSGPLSERLVPRVLAATGTELWGGGLTAEIGALFSVMGVVLVLGFALATMVRDIREIEADDEAPAAEPAA